MKVFTKEDLLALNDGDEGLVEYEYDEAFVKSLSPFGITELYLGDVTVPPIIEERIPDTEENLPDYGKCSLSHLADPQTGELFYLIDKHFLVKDETSRLSYVDFSEARLEDGSSPYPDKGKNLICPTFENLIDGHWTPDTKLMNALFSANDDEEK